MTPRLTALPEPDAASSRYRACEHPKGAHHFRAPAFAPSGRVLGFASRERERCAQYMDEGQMTPRYLMEMSATFCASIGAAWHHRTLALDTPTPAGIDITDDEWRAYGEAVADELIEAGYASLATDILPLYVVAGPLIQAGCSLVSQAAERAVFTPAQTATLTPES